MMLVDNSDSVDTEEWSMPVLDGSNGSASSETTIAAEDVAKFPGWGEQVIQRYLDSGWTIDQLSEYYQEQLKDNQ